MTPETNAKIQAIIEQYKSLGWQSVTPVEVENRRCPIIALWPNFWGGKGFSAHLNLTGKDEANISTISLFSHYGCNYLGTLQFMGHHLTPDEVKTIIETLTGETLEVVEENTEALAPVEQ